MTVPEIQTNSNGRHQAPPENSGAFALHSPLEAPASVAHGRQKRTEFPADLPARSLRSLLYSAYHHELAGTRLTRWLLIALILLGVGWALALPARWLGPSVAAVAGIALIVAVVRLRRRDFVGFEELPMPTAEPSPLSAADKIAVYATGHFAVEGQYQRFTYLPGFARTFATGEHAVLCLVRDRTFAGVSRWPALETGMWYIFFTPQLIRGVRYGNLSFDEDPRPAVAVDYQLTIPAGNGSNRTKILDETIYLVCADSADLPALLADIRCGLSSQVAQSG